MIEKPAAALTRAIPPTPAGALADNPALRRPAPDLWSRPRDGRHDPPLRHATLLVLLFHRAQAGPNGNAPEMLDAHFAEIAEHHHCVLPGEPLQPDRLNVCLTFDDGYYDFHQVVWPLLEKHGLRALLAVAPGLILDRTGQPPATCLTLPAAVANPHEISAGLCVWPELREMAGSGRVAFAAHGMTHARLDDPMVDLAREIVAPGALLENNLGGHVTSFVFPFGRYSRPALRLARDRYRHAFRIGQASNTHWGQPVLYRVIADNMAGPADLLSEKKLFRYRLRAFWNRLRRR